MNGFILMLPLFVIRFLLLGWLNPTALKRGAHFPPLVGRERIAYYVYQLANGFLLIYPLFLKAHGPFWLLVAGGVVYGVGVLLLLTATVSFAKPNSQGLNTQGSYRFSRHPLYVGYFVYFLGCALLLNAWPFYVALVLFQGASHWIILAEERWCSEMFGEAYRQYQQQVRRYF